MFSLYIIKKVFCIFCILPPTSDKSILASDPKQQTKTIMTERGDAALVRLLHAAALPCAAALGCVLAQHWCVLVRQW